MKHPYAHCADAFAAIAQELKSLGSGDDFISKMTSAISGLDAAAKDFERAHGEYKPAAVGSLTKRVEAGQKLADTLLAAKKAAKDEGVIDTAALELLLTLFGERHEDLRVVIGDTTYCLPVAASRCAAALVSPPKKEPQGAFDAPLTPPSGSRAFVFRTRAEAILKRMDSNAAISRPHCPESEPMKIGEAKPRRAGLPEKRRGAEI